jgi:hypothetical protein
MNASLVTDTEVAGHIGDLAAGLEQIEHLAPKPGRIPASPHTTPSTQGGTKIQQSDSEEVGTHPDVVTRSQTKLTP